MEPITSSSDQQPCSSGYNPEDNDKNISGSSQVDNDQSRPVSRRNALTPESHNIEPIRQTEIQEKMSSLTMTTSGDNNSDTNNNDSNMGSTSNG